MRGSKRDRRLLGREVRRRRRLSQLRRRTKKGAPAPFITGGRAELHWAEILDRVGGGGGGAPPHLRPYGGTCGLQGGATIRYHAVQNYPIHAQEFPREILALYLKAALTPVCGSHRYWYMADLAKSRGGYISTCFPYAKISIRVICYARWKAANRRMPPTRSRSGHGAPLRSTRRFLRIRQMTA